jgi:5-formyltetrahydrofolate cyclo-ligase
MTEKVLSFNLYKKAKKIAIFASKKESYEIQTDEIIAHSISNSKNIFLPRCITETRDLEFLRIQNLNEDTERAAFSIREPKEDLEVPDQNELLKDINILFVPGMAFYTKNGKRLGFGSGYYDKFIMRLKEQNPSIPIIGLGFDFQVFTEPIPFEEHDSQVDFIITPNQIIPINN